MRVILSPASEDDLTQIGDFIARDSPARALTFIQELRARCDAIAAAPEAAPLREEIAPGVRMAVHRSYLIFYRIQAEEIRIERILHGARDIRRLLGEGDGEP